MIDTVHFLIEKYGLVAVFLGCVAEGESAAIIGGFFAHQRILEPWQVFAVAFLGAFIGDTCFFILGRRFSDRPWVSRLRNKPGFSHAYSMLQAHPNLFVLSNRYIYGLRLAGGVAAGISGIAIPRFVALNALSALVWAALFCGFGYVFGLGAEHIIGDTLKAHHQLLIGLGIGLAVTAGAGFLAHHVAKKERQRKDRD